MAPYGRKSDGSPKAKPGRRPGTPNTGPRKAAPPRPKAKKQTASSGGRARGGRPDYARGIMGLLQLAAAPLMVAGAKNDAALADAAALTVHGPPIAEALDDLAQERPEFAAVLDRVLSAGPYGALLSAALPLVAQLAVNHGLVPDQIGAIVGAQPRRDLVSMLRPQQPAQAPGASTPQAA